MARFTTLARSLKCLPEEGRPALAGAGIVALSTGCCCGAGGGYGSYYGAPGGGGCDSGQCGGGGYGAGYGAPIYPQGAMAAPMGPTAAAPVYYQTAAAPSLLRRPADRRRPGQLRADVLSRPVPGAAPVRRRPARSASPRGRRRLSATANRA